MNFVEECKKLSIAQTTKFLKEFPELAAKGAETKEQQVNNISNFYAKKLNLMIKQQRLMILSQ